MKNKSHNRAAGLQAAELKPQESDWAALEAMSDTKIDYSDIPQLNDEFFRQAVRNPFYRPVKAATTVRLDTDVLALLRSQGKGYQTRINQILRDAMLKDIEGH